MRSIVTKALKYPKVPLIKDGLDYNKIVRNNGDETNLNINMNYKYKWRCISLGIIAGGIVLTGCQTVPTIEKDSSNQVIQQEFTQTAVPLTNELNDYSQIEELFLDDEENGYLDQEVRKYLKNDEMIKQNKLDLESLDLKLFESDAGETYFLAIMLDKRQVPNTIFGKLIKSKEGKYMVAGEHLAAYLVNLPKTYLLEKENTWVVVSQRPFSAFEECYFFKMENGKMKLFKRGWQDLSLLYYNTVSTLLEQQKIDEAMALPDDSMYPMGYEEPLFETANLMVRVSETQANLRESANDPKTALHYLEWSLNYYFQNHYGMDLDGMLTEKFTPLFNAVEGDFGYDYLLKDEDIKTALLHYANLLGKNGKEKAAENFKKAIDQAFLKAH